MSPQMSAVEPAVAPALSAESMFGRMCTPAFYASAPSSASNSPRRLAVRSSPSSGGEGEGVPTVGGSFSMRSSQGSGQRAPPAGKGAPAGARARAGTPGRSVAGQMLARARRPRLAGRSGSLDGGPARLGSSDGARARIPHQCPTLTEQRRFKAAVRRTEVNMRVNLPMPEDDAFLIRVVRSRGFSIGIAVLILFSTVMIGVETQLLSSLSSQEESSSEQLVSALSVTNYALTLLFTAELVVRLYAFRFDFFVHERVWNFFDVIILVLALAEVALEIVVKAVSGTRGDMFGAAGGSAKVLRLFRLTRLLRLVRTIRQLKPLRLLLHSLFCAGKSVFWALLLLFIIVYSFGVILTQAVTEHTESGTRVEDELLMDYYGNLYRSMLSLWWAVSGGISWNELTEPLERTGSSLWVALSPRMTSRCSTHCPRHGVGFCQNAIEGAQQDLELTIESQLREKQVYADRLRLLFEEMNECSTDRSEGLTAAEINFQLAKPKVQSWFKSAEAAFQSSTWILSYET
ncbi:unnamed protein product [Prorocentrum cordatum]|uniref:Ion transport domain-containing protein n=1 Tax=Prorocentrum cordatum TaxID=2364126 RepID=A0ABN9RWU4_9DINO|nr:unnamed protein product [Polarella glacialis]